MKDTERFAKRLRARSPQRVSISNTKKGKPPLPSDGLITFVLMKNYKHLTREQRYTIYLERQRGQSMESIALTIGMVWRLLPYKSDALKTITTDNGSEFAEYEWITKKLGVPVYFADSYCSWQKGQ